MLKVFIENSAEEITFYRDSFRRYVYIAIGLLIINICLVVYLYYSQLTVVESPTFATTSDGRIIRIYPS